MKPKKYLNKRNYKNKRNQWYSKQKCNGENKTKNWFLENLGKKFLCKWSRKGESTDYYSQGCKEPLLEILQTLKKK